MTTQEEYIRRHSMAEPAELAELYRTTHLRRLYSRMCCEPLQGRLWVMLTRMIKPRRILELGTFSGYSALCFAEGMPDGAELHTIEIDDEAEPHILEAFSRSPRAKDIHLHIGDAKELIPQLSTEPWDLVYIDANKRDYLDYYLLVKPHVRPGGFIIADNTLWSGNILDDHHADAQTQGIRKFNEYVAADPAATPLLLPLFDGITLVQINSH